MKIVLVLSGGAARGAFHLGVIEALQEAGVDIAAVSGSSIGAIVGAALAAGTPPRRQMEIFKSKAFRKALKFNGLKKGVLRIDQKSDILQKLVPVPRLESMRIPIHITTLDLYSGEIVRFAKGDAISLCVASSAVVPLFRPISYEGYRLVDGGIMDNLPVEPLKQYDLPIVAVDLHPQQRGYNDSMWGIVKRSVFLMWRASVQRQIGMCDHYITHPDLSTYPLFSFKDLDAMFELGYRTAQAYPVLKERE